MTFHKDASSIGATGRKNTGMGVFGETLAMPRKESSSTTSAFSSNMGVDLPIPMKNGHASVLHDTGAGFSILSGPGSSNALQDPNALIGQQHEKMVHLDRSLLVRLNITRKSGETISVLCTSEEVGRTGVRVHLPCKMGLESGINLDAELFLNGSIEPTTTHGIVRSVDRMSHEDINRFMIEIEFSHLSSRASEEISSFLHKADMKSRIKLVS